MIFADKLIQLRKKNGWSQEELADKMNVTRQSVSKWEGAGSVPDLEKMIGLSNLFGVTTDYLLKDELEETEQVEYGGEIEVCRRVSMEEANAFLSIKAKTAKSIAGASLLCILSPLCLLVLSAVAEMPGYGLGENVAGGIGVMSMLILVTIAVAIFIASGSKTAHFEYLEKEVFETEYGVTGMVKERKEKFKDTYTKYNIIGACLCILSVAPLFAAVAVNEENELFLVLTLPILFILVGIGVTFFIRGGVVFASFEKLLQEGDYSKVKKERQSVTGAISTAYWLTATAIYLVYSLTTKNWENSWIIWLVAGLLFPALITVINVLVKKD